MAAMSDVDARHRRMNPSVVWTEVFISPPATQDVTGTLRCKMGLWDHLKYVLHV